MSAHPGYSAASLLRHYKAARSWEPDRPFVCTSTWGDVLTAREWLRWFQDCLMRKIASHEPAPTGRKHSDTWQLECERLARAVNTPRLIVRYCPIPEYRERLAHRLTGREDF
jgi:hypothetical protein